MSGIVNDIHIMRAERLIDLLRRAHLGEDPDMLYLEVWANGTHWQIGEKEEDDE